MAKRGLKHHQKRITVSKEVPVTNKKEYKWITRSSPGPHRRKHSMPLVVLLREILGIAKTAREVKIILHEGSVLVDGKTRKKTDFPVGFMDILSLPAIDKQYRMEINEKGKLQPNEISKNEANTKILKVVKKHTAPKGKIIVTFHDGRTIIGDNNISIGDSICFSLKDYKLASLLKLQAGAKCIIREGKHAGTIATLKDIMKRKGRDDEALVDTGKTQFVTVAKYLFVVTESFKGGA